MCNRTGWSFEIRLYLFRNVAILACVLRIQCYDPLPMSLLPAMHNLLYNAYALRDAEHAILTTFYPTKIVTALVCVLYRRLHFIVTQIVCGAGLFFCLVCTVT